MGRTGLIAAVSGLFVAGAIYLQASGDLGDRSRAVGGASTVAEAPATQVDRIRAATRAYPERSREIGQAPGVHQMVVPLHNRRDQPRAEDEGEGSLDADAPPGVVAQIAPLSEPVRTPRHQGRSTHVQEPGELQALRALAAQSMAQPFGEGSEQSLANGRIFGARSNLGGGTTNAPAGVVPSPTPVPTPEQVDLLERVAGQARGYTALALMQPEARASSEKLVEIMLRAQLAQGYLGVLVDGTFGFDVAYLRSVVERLHYGDRSLVLALYLTNGATQRRFEETPIRAPFVTIEPAEFRQRIKFDERVRNEFRTLVRRIRPIVELNEQLHPESETVVVVMLEDNLDRSSYFTMRSIAQEELPPTVQYVRNPCMGCYPGNDEDRVDDALELHAVDQLPRLGAGDGFTLDGTSFTFPWEPQEGVPGLEQVRAFLDASFAQGLRYFGLWRAERQGIPQNDSSAQLRLPADREYEVPSEAQALEEIALLRHGLPLVPRLE